MTHGNLFLGAAGAVGTAGSIAAATLLLACGRPGKTPTATAAAHPSEAAPATPAPAVLPSPAELRALLALPSTDSTVHSTPAATDSALRTRRYRAPLELVTRTVVQVVGELPGWTVREHGDSVIWATHGAPAPGAEPDDVFILVGRTGDSTTIDVRSATHGAGPPSRARHVAAIGELYAGLERWLLRHVMSHPPEPLTRT